ncbi:hypothetical protein FUAX_23890 [Fulvitalea axinellae]|uniref:Teneurin NHL domain-containing protein n=1 Tax=Fulvitalea axinellae TaxID=1182444 RepID=A0AAU9CPS2_9BACT|nr:hypothetical protein FUAX_23890 [Fulvitalea axinellae]
MRKIRILTLIVALGLFALGVKAQRITTFAGDGIDGFAGDGDKANKARLNYPLGVELSPDKTLLYIFDTFGHRIRKVNLQDSIITTIAGIGISGETGDGGLATEAEINTPIRGAFDNAGNLYFAEFWGNKIRKISVDGTITTIAGTGAHSSGPDGGLAIETALFRPADVAVDAQGNIYVAEQDANKVRIIFPNGVISTYAGDGTAASTGDNGPVSQAKVNKPSAVEFGPDGNLYIVEQGGQRIRKVVGGIISTVAGIGSRGYSGDGGSARNAEMNEPSSISFDQTGAFYFSDNENYVVRKVDVTGNISTVAGNGNFGYSGDGGRSGKASLGRPFGLAVLPTGDFFIADGENLRVRKVAYEGRAVPKTDFPNQTVSFGIPDFQLQAITNSPGNLSFSLLNGAGIVELSGTNNGTLKVLNTGEAVIRASIAGTDSWWDDEIDMKLTVEKGVPVITINDAERTFGDQPFVLDGETSIPAELEYELIEGEGIVELLGAYQEVVSIKGAGTARILVTSVEDNNVESSSKEITIVINKAEPTLNFSDLVRTYGDSPFKLLAEASFETPVSFEVVEGQSVVELMGNSMDSLNILNAGTAKIRAFVTGTDDILPIEKEVSLTILKAQPEVHMGRVTKVYGNIPVHLEAFSDSDGSISFEVIEGGDVFALSGSNNSFLGSLKSGTGKLRAYTTETSNYLPADLIVQVTVTRAEPELYNVEDIQMSTLEGPHKTFIVSDSDGKVAFDVISGGDIIKMNGDTVVTLGQGGVARVRASVPKTDKYNALAEEFEVDVTVLLGGIQTANHDNEVRVFPVPSDGLVNVGVDDPQKLDFIKINALTGQEVVYMESGAQDKYQFDLERGVYVLVIKYDDKLVKKTVLVK